MRKLFLACVIVLCMWSGCSISLAGFLPVVPICVNGMEVISENYTVTYSQDEFRISVSPVDRAESYWFFLTDGTRKEEYNYPQESYTWAGSLLPGTQLTAYIVAYDAEGYPIARTNETTISFEYPAASFNIAASKSVLTKDDTVTIYTYGGSQGPIRFYSQQDNTDYGWSCYAGYLGECDFDGNNASMMNVKISDSANHMVYAIDSEGNYSNRINISVHSLGTTPMPQEIRVNGQKVSNLQSLNAGTASLTLWDADEQTTYTAYIWCYSEVSDEPTFCSFSFSPDEYYAGLGFVSKFTVPENMTKLSVQIDGEKKGYDRAYLSDEYKHRGDTVQTIQNICVNGDMIGDTINVKAYSKPHISFDPVEGAEGYRIIIDDTDAWWNPSPEFEPTIFDHDITVELVAFRNGDEIISRGAFSVRVIGLEPAFEITPSSYTILYGDSFQLNTSTYVGRESKIVWTKKDNPNTWLREQYIYNTESDSVSVPDNFITEDCILWMETGDGRRSNVIELTVRKNGKLNGAILYLDGERVDFLRSTSALVQHTLTFQQVEHASFYLLQVEIYDENESYIGGEYEYGTYNEVNGLVFEASQQAAYVRISIEARGIGYESSHWTSNKILINVPACVGYQYDSETHYALDANGNILWSEEHTGKCDQLNTCLVCGASDVVIPNIDHIGEIEVEPVDTQWHHLFCSVCGTEVYRENHFSECTEPDYCNACGATGVINGYIHHDPGEMQYNDSIHYRECSNCGKRVEVSIHYADCFEPDVCVICGAEQIIAEIGHEQTTIQSDEKYHWYVCDICGQEEEERWSHRVSCRDRSICLECGHTDPDDYVFEHTTDGQWYSDDSGHWQICEECGEKVCYGPHEIDCNQTKCLLCGYSGEYNRFVCHFYPEYEVYEHNESIHWFTCAECGTIVKSLHYFTCYEPGVCQICRVEIVPDADEIQHTMRQTQTGYGCIYCGWKPDEGQHEHIWECAEIAPLYYRCRICGKAADNDDDVSTAIPHGDIYYDREQHYQYCRMAGELGHVYSAPHEFVEGVCSFCGYVKPFDPTQLEEHNILRLPVSLTVICSEAFAGVDADTVYFSAGCTSIESRAFADSKIISVHIPADNCAIADDAFEGCGRVYIYCAEDSEVAAWCDRNDILHGTETNE